MLMSSWTAPRSTNPFSKETAIACAGSGQRARRQNRTEMARDGRVTTAGGAEVKEGISANLLSPRRSCIER